MHRATTDKIIRPSCPECGSQDIAEMTSTMIEFPVVAVRDGRAHTGAGQTASDREFVAFECRACFYETGDIGDFLASDPQSERGLSPGAVKADSSAAAGIETKD